MSNWSAPESSPFGPSFIVDPLSTHTHTMIMLHGRGSDGQEYAEEFFSSSLADGTTLAQKLPGFRWVFPSAQALWSTTFQEPISAWFEAHSLTDITARQDLQMSGIKDSVQYLQYLLDGEVTELGGQGRNVFLCGISQGAAIGLWTLLCRDPTKEIGAFLGASTWLPLSSDIAHVLGIPGQRNGELASSAADDLRPNSFVEDMLSGFVRNRASHPQWQSLCKIFLGHGVDDAYVDVTLGIQARDVLLGAGFAVDWREYSGAEQEGHWYKVPDEVDDMYDFITLTLEIPTRMVANQAQQ